MPREKKYGDVIIIGVIVFFFLSIMGLVAAIGTNKPKPQTGVAPHESKAEIIRRYEGNSDCGAGRMKNPLVGADDCVPTHDKNGNALYYAF